MRRRSSVTDLLKQQRNKHTIYQHLTTFVVFTAKTCHFWTFVDVCWEKNAGIQNPLESVMVESSGGSTVWFILLTFDALKQRNSVPEGRKPDWALSVLGSDVPASFPRAVTDCCHCVLRVQSCETTFWPLGGSREDLRFFSALLQKCFI